MYPLMFWLAILGLLISAYILYAKGWNKKLVCLIGEDCDRVVKSRYGYLFFGIPNELFGVVYYALAAMLFGADVGTRSLFPAIAAIAFLASLYLAAVQAFVLREWCEFCLITAAINGIILFFILP